MALHVVPGSNGREPWEAGPPPGQFDDDEAGSGASDRASAASSDTGSESPPIWEALLTPVPADWFTKCPPSRKWLLRDSRRPKADGVLPMGKAVAFIAEGGAGKTMALIQLAIAVATGEKWLGTFDVATPGRVLMILGEEDKEEVQRRMFNAFREVGQRGQALPPPNSIVALPLHGCPCAMLARGEYGNAVSTAFAEWLVAHVKETGPWSLIILDPLSRFAGPDAEKENAYGTLFVQAVERLSMETGAVALVSHHSNQTSRNGATLTASSARGVTALTDGFRWVAGLTVQDASQGLESLEVRERLGDVVTFSHVKSNYSRRADPLSLRRVEGGPLVPLDEIDRKLVGEALDGKAAKAAGREVERKRRQEERATQEAAERAAKALAQDAKEQLEVAALVAILLAQPGIHADPLRAEMAAKLHGCSRPRLAEIIARVGSAVRTEVGLKGSLAHYLHPSTAT